MKFLFTKISLLALSVYAVLCVQGVLIAPKDFWSVVAICFPVFLVLAIEDR